MDDPNGKIPNGGRRRPGGLGSNPLDRPLRKTPQNLPAANTGPSEPIAPPSRDAQVVAAATGGPVRGQMNHLFAPSDYGIGAGPSARSKPNRNAVPAGASQDFNSRPGTGPVHRDQGSLFDADAPEEMPDFDKLLRRGSQQTQEPGGMVHPGQFPMRDSLGPHSQTSNENLVKAHRRSAHLGAVADLMKPGGWKGLASFAMGNHLHPSQTPQGRELLYRQRQEVRANSWAQATNARSANGNDRAAARSAAQEDKHGERVAKAQAKWKPKKTVSGGDIP